MGKGRHNKGRGGGRSSRSSRRKKNKGSSNNTPSAQWLASVEGATCEHCGKTFVAGDGGGHTAMGLLHTRAKLEHDCTPIAVAHIAARRKKKAGGRALKTGGSKKDQERRRKAREKKQRQRAAKREAREAELQAHVEQRLIDDRLVAAKYGKYTRGGFEGRTYKAFTKKERAVVLAAEQKKADAKKKKAAAKKPWDKFKKN